jgi:transposase
MPLTDEQWRLVQPLLPAALPEAPRRRGRPPGDPRRTLDAILLKLAGGDDFTWRRLPSWQTAYHAYRRWKQDGSLRKVLVALRRDLCTRGRFDFRDALDAGQVLLVYAFPGFGVYLPPSMPLTWQLETALLFYRQILEVIEQKRGFGYTRGVLAAILDNFAE